MVAHGHHVFRVERARRQSVALQVVHRAHHRLEHLASFRLRQRTLANRRGQRLVGIFEHRVEHHVAGQLGPSAIQQGAHVRMLQTARSLPQGQLRAGIQGGRGHQLDRGAAAIGRAQCFEVTRGIIAARPPFEKIIPGQGHTFPVFPQLTHVSIIPRRAVPPCFTRMSLNRGQRIAHCSQQFIRVDGFWQGGGRAETPRGFQKRPAKGS